MPPENGPGSSQDWLRYARSDLAVAAQRHDSIVLYETLCYHAQQAAEKSLKAVFVHFGIEFPYTHNVARLVTIAQDAGISWPGDLDEAAELTEYAVQLRYPGTPRQVTEEELSRAVEIAQRVLLWAEDTIARPIEPV